MENLNIHLIAALTDPQVIEQFGKLIDKRTNKTHEAVLELQNTVFQLLKKLDERDKQIRDLQIENDDLREELDTLQQYSRKPSIRVFGIPEGDHDNTDDLLIKLFNNKMKIKPKVQLTDIEISHRVGRKWHQPPDSASPNQAKTPTAPRAIIARFASRRVKGNAMSAKRVLRPKRKKTRNTDEREEAEEVEGDEEEVEDEDDADVDIDQLFPRPVYISDDLTPRRARLAKLARDRKRAGKLQDTWIFYGRIMAKDNRSRIMEIKRETHLPN